MFSTRIGTYTVRLAAGAALVVISAAVAGAQKAKPAHEGPPATTHGQMKANAAAAKGQATAEAKRVDAAADKAARDADHKEDQAKKAEKKADKAEDKAEKTGDKAQDKTAKDADRKADRAERRAISSARAEPKELLKGVKLSSTERTAVKAIETKYNAQLADLEKQQEAAEKAGKPDATIMAKIDALRTQERADLRAALSAAQQSRFDKNAAKVKK